MTSAGYAFILVAIFLLRQVAVGRAKDIPSDAKTLFSGLLNMDFESVGNVLAGRGENVPVGSSPVASDPTGTLSIANSVYAAKVVALGEAAKGYRLGAEGPDYYDCSGLTWKAGYELGIYKGPRYTTATFHKIAGSWTKQVADPGVGDLILWPNKHIGVFVGADTMYSARSTQKGIGRSSISGDVTYFGTQPEYWRINA